MSRSRLLTAAAGLLLSLLVSVVAYVYLDTLLLFLFLPLVPFLFRGRGDDEGGRTGRTCPECGFHTRDPGYDYCPRDGTPLE